MKFVKKKKIILVWIFTLVVNPGQSSTTVEVQEIKMQIVEISIVN